MAVELAPDYYLVNFKQLVGFVATTYAEFLIPQELAFHSQFCALSSDAQKLYVRLLCRSKNLFRAGKLAYSEIGDMPGAVQQLHSAGFISIEANHSLETLLPLYTRAELLQRLPLDLNRSTRRPEVEQAALALAGQSFACASLLQDETLVEVLQQSHFDLYRLCFFGNLYQDMTDFVLRDLGMTRFENYPISRHNRAFQSRAQILAHLQYYACSEQLEDVLADTPERILALHAALPVADAADANLKRRVDRLTNTLARQLERLGQLESALQLYRQTDRPPSRERQARVLATLEQKEAALAVCQTLLHDPFNDEEKQFAEQFGARLAKSTGQEWSKVPRYRPPQESIELAQRDVSVELLVAEYYADQGECYYTENVLFGAVFGLACWDIIFAPLRGVFHNPFQHAPADFYEPDFKRVRQAQLQQRWIEIGDQSALRQRVMDTFNAKQGIQNPMVHWQYLPQELLETALERIPLSDWRCVFDRLLDDLRHNRSGFPDLVLFPRQGGYCLIEVKGPGDTLQKNQIRWMACFADQGIAHKVSYVSWAATAESCL